MRDTLNQIFSFFCLIVSFAWSTGICIIALPTFLINEKKGHDLHRIWAKGWLWIWGIQVSYYGLEKLPKKGSILAANHQSNFDIFVMATLPVNFKWISKKEVFRIPFMGWAMKAMGTFRVSRDHSGKDLSTMKEVEDGLLIGKNVAIFPEGTRTRTGEMLPFKKGAFRIAQNVSAPLYPISIMGTRNIAAPGKLPRWGHKVKLRVGDPLFVGKGEDLNNVMAAFKEKLVQLMGETAL